jgi:acetylornithine aminotransferase
MKPFDVYPLYPIEPVSAQGCWIWDKEGQKYLDFYGGHAVISIGHTHTHYISRISEQMQKIGFYSNSVSIPQQKELAEKLGALSGYTDFDLFLCNSGAEANENAFKLASFKTGRKKFISIKSSFHGRTSAAVAATDDPSIIAPVNESDNFIFVEMNNEDLLEKAFSSEIAGLIIEGIQGIGGIILPSESFLNKAQELCRTYSACLILDEVQSGYGRSGKFFAHQYYDIKPDLITVAKGMGNGFPIGGVLISPEIKPKHKMLGTTFGGSHLACAAALAVIEVIEHEDLIQQAEEKGNYLISRLKELPHVTEVRGKGLMIGLELDIKASEISRPLLFEQKVFTGSSNRPNTMRLLPPLTISYEEIDHFVNCLKTVCASIPELVKEEAL